MTYSIVARDPATGELGIGVQSHWFAVGAVVPWARPGVGAVATQSLVEVSYGPNALELPAAGEPATVALERLVAADPGSPVRQVAVIDSRGRTATHTGANCIGFAGHVAGEGVSCQANMMRSPTVWGAMLDRIQRGGRPAGRPPARGLDAAEAEGGDARGRRSAALLVVPAEGETWEAGVSLRVDDHPEPLAELRRLLELNSAYAVINQAEILSSEGRHEEAGSLFTEAGKLAPESHELRFWAGLGARSGGRSRSRRCARPLGDRRRGGLAGAARALAGGGRACRNRGARCDRRRARVIRSRRARPDSRYLRPWQCSTASSRAGPGIPLTFMCAGAEIRSSPTPPRPRRPIGSSGSCATAGRPATTASRRAWSTSTARAAG